MKSLCGADCANCQWNSTCPGCSDEKCFIARYIKKDGKEAYEEFKQSLIDEFNALGIPGMPKINELYALVGNFVNLEYPLHSGQKVKFLDNNSMYLGNHLVAAHGPAVTLPQAHHQLCGLLVVEDRIRRQDDFSAL